MMTKNLVSIVGLILALSVRAAVAAPYTFTTFDVPGGTETAVLGINDVGQIVGSYTMLPDPVFNYAAPAGFFDDVRTGVITSISCCFTTRITDVNNAGQIAGYGTISAATLRLQRDPATGALSTVNQPGTQGINDAGQLVGQVVTFRGPSSSLLYDPVNGNSSISDPSSPGYTAANDINNRGQVVGSTLDAGFLLDLATGKYTAIDVPGSTRTQAYHINDNGQIVGSYDVGNSTNGYLLDLSTGSYTTIDVPGATLTSVDGINNAGDIVGSYFDANRVQHGFIAAPSSAATVPEPASLALLGSSICALALARRRNNRPAA